MSKHIIVFSTIDGEKKAKKLASKLVKRRLVACVNIVPKIRSIYEWDGEIHDENESLMIMKTKSDLFDELKEFITKNHGYEVPEIISIDIKDGLQTYLDWIDGVTAT
ncbi:MAG: divalent-cation tolerance protein CutA [Pseudomonadota bacterium]